MGKIVFDKDRFLGMTENENYIVIEGIVSHDMTWDRVVKAVGEDAEAKGLLDRTLSANHYRGMIISELGEAIQADRSNKHANYRAFLECLSELQPDNIYASDVSHWAEMDKDLYKIYFERIVAGTFEDELADVVLRICSFAYMFHLHVSPAYCNSLPLIDKRETFPEFVNFVCQRISEEIGTTSLCEMNLDFVLTDIFYYCHKHRIDIENAILYKFYYNKLREPGHGKKY